MPSIQGVPAVALGVSLGVSAVALGVRVSVGVGGGCVAVGGTVSVGVGGREVAVGVLVGVRGVAVALAVTVGVGVWLGVGVTLGVGVRVSVAVGVRLGGMNWVGEGAKVAVAGPGVNVLGKKPVALAARVAPGAGLAVAVRTTSGPEVEVGRVG